MFVCETFGIFFYFMKRLIVAVMALVAATTATAQSTTASLSGFVMDNEGKPLAGAAVVATHTPTETVYGTITDANGAYHLQGLRVGGPYIVEFSFVGYNTKKYDNIAFALGENQQINTTLNDTLDIDAVVVRTDGFSDRKTGSSARSTYRSLTRRGFTLPLILRSLESKTSLVLILTQRQFVSQGFL
jgi:hypothetical protein